jgi:hypothetical protein
MIAYVTVVTEKLSNGELNTESMKVDVTGYDSTIPEMRAYIKQHCQDHFQNETVISVTVLKTI